MCCRARPGAGGGARAARRAAPAEGCRRPRATSSARSGWSRSGHAPSGPRRRRRATLVGGDRLVLDAVVGGEVAVAERDHRRHQADRRAIDLAQRCCPRPPRSSEVAPEAAATAARTGGPRTAAAPQAAAAGPAGSTKASARFSGPRSPGTSPTSPGASAGLRSEATRSRRPSPHRRGPGGRPVDQEPVAQGHAAEAELLRLIGGHTPTIGTCVRPLSALGRQRTNAEMRRASSPVHSTPSLPPVCNTPDRSPQSRSPAGVVGSPWLSLVSRL